MAMQPVAADFALVGLLIKGSWVRVPPGSPSKTCPARRLAFHGIDASRPKAESVTHVSGTKCHPCLGPLSRTSRDSSPACLGIAPSSSDLDRNPLEFSYQKAAPGGRSLRSSGQSG